MKKVHLICVGKLKEDYLKAGVAEYAKRLTRFCSFKITELSDCADKDNPSVKESDVILPLLGKQNVLFDIKGEQLSSEDLAVFLDKSFINSDEVTFIIGGSFGVDNRVKESAHKKISFGRVTYPHQLMRLIATEQIYRAFNIVAGTPYHK